MASKSSSIFLLVLIQMLVLELAQAQLIFPPPNFPGLPIPRVPIIPGFPGAPLPQLPIPRLPIPGFPGAPLPELPVPGIPGLPIPRIPIIPGTPGTQIPNTFPEIQECWAAIINIGGCYAEIFRAFQSGQASYTVGPTCCKVIKDLSSTCWPRMFPFNPFFPPQLQNYCSRYTNPLPVNPPTTDAPVSSPVAPAPEDDSPVAPAPEDDSPVAPAPEEDSPAPEGDAPAPETESWELL